jgi:uncharacterized protein
MPLTRKGQEILAALLKEYGSEEKAKEVLYAGKNSGRFTGIDEEPDGIQSGAIRFYTTDQISPNQYLTSEGYLVCKDVAVARCGEQLYLPEELVDLETGKQLVRAGKDGLVRIDRLPEHVFHQDTIHSFNCKPVTLGHPSFDVNPSNWRELAKGVVQNVRQGAGTSNDLLLADLVITDQEAIQAVRNGLREISCGYDAAYQELEPGRGLQKNIIGNHVAILQKGRCGSRCAIGDQQMAKTTKWHDRLTAFQDKIRAAFKSQDKDALEKAFKDAEGDPEGLVAEMRETLEEIGEKVDKVDGKVDDLAEKHDKFDGRLEEVEKKTKDALARLKAHDESEEEEKKRKEREARERAEDEERERKRKEEETKGAAKDSAGLLEEWQDTVARAEIIAPGLQLPTHDGASKAAAVRDSICALRRKALETAFHGKNHDAVAPFVGSAPDFTKITCDAARSALVGASEVMRVKNNSVASSVAHAARDEFRNTTDRIAAMNEANKKLWARK